MHVWSLAPDARGKPQRVTPGSRVELVIGTWPIQPGQLVTVEYRVTPYAAERPTDGHVGAWWVENRGENSYWRAALGQFADGDVVEYRVVGRRGPETVATPWDRFSVRPAIHLALVWHHHQPLYRVLSDEGPGRYRLPWVRLHALRDYYGMAHVVAQHPGVHVTFNFSGVLLRQLEDYLRSTPCPDRALRLTVTPTARMTDAEAREALETFFDADWHHQIFPHARYRQLFEQRVSGARFSVRDLTDLKMWFNLAWFAQEFRAGIVTLPGGGSASVARFVERGESFTQADIEAMVEEQWKILTAIVPLHRALEARGQIEVSITPDCHPILPLLIDTDAATLDRPGTSLPHRFAHPEDAEAQVANAVELATQVFGRAPRGMWPAEGAVCEAMLPLLGRHGIRWIASDEGVLARSGHHGYRVDDPGILCQPYRPQSAGAENAPSLFFRSRELSDAIGFHYHAAPDAAAAAASFVSSVKALAARLRCERDYVVTVVLDGDNAWGSYPEDGRPFLHALYAALASDNEIKTLTPSEYIDGSPSRRLPAHPQAEQNAVYHLFTGSWIDEPGSLPGVDLGTWIGEPEENEAWELLGFVRDRLDVAGVHPTTHPDAFAALYAAEGSDWFWWFGDDRDSGVDDVFDDLFRSHLRTACELGGIPAPSALDRHIVPHRALWTFAAPVRDIQAGDRLLVRTNCPGIVTWTTDAWKSVTHARLELCGGALAGASYHTVALGPFAGGTVLGFRFTCECVACACEGAACCRGDEWTVKVVECGG